MSTGSLPPRRASVCLRAMHDSEPEEGDVNPLAVLSHWHQEAIARNFWASAYVLSTVGPEGAAGRAVFVSLTPRLQLGFGCSAYSRKAAHLSASPQCALTAVWPDAGRQVRVEGLALLADRAATEAAFRMMPRGGQLLAWTSRNSERSTPTGISDRLKATGCRFPGKVPFSDDWAYFVVEPSWVELWEADDDWAHKCVRYVGDAASAPMRWRATWIDP